VASEIEAFLLEANLVKKYKPFYNIKLSDDKTFPYIKISKKDVPYVTITRKKDQEKAVYYGPYPDATSTKIVLKIMRRIFPFQNVKNHPKNKCLYNHLGLCPCASVFSERLPEYKKNIKKLEYFLSGKKKKIIDELRRERENFVKTEEFEKASQVQDKIERITLITSPFYSPFQYEKNPDTYAIHVKEEVESLKNILSKYYTGLKSLEKIECFDISNIQGTNATGGMVVFLNGEPVKNFYRRFRIKSLSTPDDFGMMREIISRRIKHKEWSKPDLIVVDGGKGQLRAAFEILHKNNFIVPVIGLAKKEEKIVFIDYTSHQIHFLEVKLKLDTPGINLLRRIRDEAHRFAITYHRLLRKKNFLKH